MSDKQAKLKIPKRVAGVKIPKKLRKKAKVAIAFAESPLARELIVAGLTAAAAALANSKEGRRAAKAAVDHSGDAAENAAHTAHRASEAFAAIAREVALGLVAAYVDGRRRANGKASEAAH